MISNPLTLEDNDHDFDKRARVRDSVITQTPISQHSLSFSQATQNQE